MILVQFCENIILFLFSSYEKKKKIIVIEVNERFHPIFLVTVLCFISTT